MRNLFWHEIRSRWLIMVGLGLVLTIMGTVYITVYPLIVDQLPSFASMPIIQLVGFDLASFAGWIASVAGQILPVVVSVYMVVAATGTLAGEEENGTLELVLASAVKRWQVLTVKALALMAIGLGILLILATGAAFVFSQVRQTVEVDVTEGQLFAAFLSVWPLLITLIMMGLCLASLLPSRSLAVSLMLVVIIVSYLFKSLGGLVDGIGALRPWSLYEYIDFKSLFESGLQPGDLAVLLGLAAVFYLLALWGFERRSLTVGAMPWWRFLRPRQPQTGN